MSDGSPVPRVRVWDVEFNLLHDTDTDGPVPFTCNTETAAQEEQP